MYLEVPHINNFYSDKSKLKSFNICTIPKINYFMDKIVKRGKDKVEKIRLIAIATIHLMFVKQKELHVLEVVCRLSYCLWNAVAYILEMIYLNFV